MASFWCATNPIFRWRTWAPSSAVILALLATLLALLPAFLREVRRPSPQGLVAAMAASSWAFFLFSYHAHEKSVLFPLLPTLLLSALPLSGPPDATSPALALAPRLVPLVVAASVASMAPLLSRDALLLPSAAALAAFLATVAAWGSLDERPSAADWASAAGATGFEPAKTRGAIMAAMVPARPWDAVRGAPAPAPAGVEAAPRPPPAVKEGCCARSREVDGGAGGLERQRSGGCFPGCLLPSTRRRLQRRSSGMSPSNHPLPWPAVEERGTDVGDEGGEEAGALSSQATRGEREEGPGAWLRSADRASALAMRFAPDWALRAVSGLVGWDMVAVGSGEGASAQWKGPGWAGAPPGVAFLALVTMCGALAVLGVGLAAMVLQPPDRFPYLFDYLAVASSFAVFAGVTVWVNAAHAELAGE